MIFQGKIYGKNLFAAVMRKGIYKAFSYFATALLFRTSWGKDIKWECFHSVYDLLLVWKGDVINVSSYS